jgi:hypothetical protein
MISRRPLRSAEWKMPDFKEDCTYAVMVADDMLTTTSAGLAAA